ncbi:MAG: hypothetical protein A2498_15905 [Lentisphaerae bacterium RIFOXYC12_FULL_60_16]|nr:MAG: hypothetical protein A2498_15905 [Lentisphaerae bacterium RIFOXYC12_FULL_60_16]OGV70114.1 MAG: hypothetical protein A2269_06745 [Lentisphaerae bacterium RIFOXYA12_FULL_60_10]OGV79140.1 MAG: hypothetical protein A2340_03385 [Lentisphaerae bacterium RIFOXYB12_FULL_60_10]
MIRPCTPLTLLLMLLCLPVRSAEPDMELLRYCRDESIPFELFTCYSRFVTAIGGEPAGQLAGFCDTNKVTITTDPRPAGKETTGDTINLPFMKTGFRKHLIEVLSRNETEYQLRTASSILVFKKQDAHTWTLIQYRDEPMVPAPDIPGTTAAPTPANAP